MIELVVFDMAGTTVRDQDDVGACFRATLAAAGVAVDVAAADAVMGLPKPEAIRRMLTGVGRSDLLADVDRIHADFVGRMRHHYTTHPGVGEVPGAAAVFAELRRAGVKVALNTGFSRAVTQALLDRLGWSGSPPAVDASVCSDEVPRGRPYPDMVWHLMRQLGVSDARNVAKVGDTPVDLEEGTSAGCGLVIGVTSGRGRREQLLAAPHTHLVASVVDVPRLCL